MTRTLVLLLSVLLLAAPAWAGWKMYAPGNPNPVISSDASAQPTILEQPAPRTSAPPQRRQEEPDDIDTSGIEWRQTRGLYSGRNAQGTKPYGYKAGSYRLEYKYRGGTNFIVWLHSRRGLQKLMVNVISSRKGSSCMRLKRDDEVWFEVDTGGNWEFTFERTGS